MVREGAALYCAVRSGSMVWYGTDGTEEPDQSSVRIRARSRASQHYGNSLMHRGAVLEGGSLRCSVQCRLQRTSSRRVSTTLCRTASSCSTEHHVINHPPQHRHSTGRTPAHLTAGQSTGLSTNLSPLASFMSLFPFLVRCLTSSPNRWYTRRPPLSILTCALSFFSRRSNFRRKEQQVGRYVVYGLAVKEGRCARKRPCSGAGSASYVPFRVTPFEWRVFVRRP